MSSPKQEVLTICINGRKFALNLSQFDNLTRDELKRRFNKKELSIQELLACYIQEINKHCIDSQHLQVIINKLG